jgi:hypothetical protein
VSLRNDESRTGSLREVVLHQNDLIGSPYRHQQIVVSVSVEIHRYDIRGLGPNGDILANSWFPYTGDKLYSFFYDSSTRPSGSPPTS